AWRRIFPALTAPGRLGFGARTARRTSHQLMTISTFDILRCPYCGSRLDLVTSSFNEKDGDQIHTGILGCQCCVFPVIDGIPVMHLQPHATMAREFVEKGDPLAARRAMFGLDEAPGAAERVDTLIASRDATYRAIVEAF